MSTFIVNLETCIYLTHEYTGHGIPVDIPAALALQNLNNNNKKNNTQFMGNIFYYLSSLTFSFYMKLNTHTQFTHTHTHTHKIKTKKTMFKIRYNFTFEILKIKINKDFM